MAYIDYVSCYLVAYKEYYHHRSRSAAVVFWVLCGLFQSTTLVYWISIFAKGPGVVPTLRHLDIYGTQSPDTQPLPNAFVCDEQGYPFWCSKSQKLKPDRSFYSKHIQTLVPKFDHFCLWIGTAIGRNNYLCFLKFLQWGIAHVVTITIFSAVAVRPLLRRHDISLAYFVVMFVLCGFALVLCSSLYFVALFNMMSNSTTFDNLTVKSARSYKRWTSRQEKLSPKRKWLSGKQPRQESGIRYINIAHKGRRLVVPYNVRDQPYSLGFRKNLINTCLRGNYSRNDTAKTYSTMLFLKATAVFLIPFTDLFSHSTQPFEKDSFEGQSDDFSPSFIEFIEKKIARKSFREPSYSQNTQSEHSEENHQPKSDLE